MGTVGVGLFAFLDHNWFLLGWFVTGYGATDFLRARV